METTLINLTPHVLNLFDETGTIQLVTLPPDGRIARVAVKKEKVGEVNGIPKFAVHYGQVEGLPDPEENTIYIVSFLVCQAAPERKDLVSPGELIRNAEGNPVGAKGVSVN